MAHWIYDILVGIIAVLTLYYTYLSAWYVREDYFGRKPTPNTVQPRARFTASLAARVPRNRRLPALVGLGLIVLFSNWLLLAIAFGVFGASDKSFYDRSGLFVTHQILKPTNPLQNNAKLIFYAAQFNGPGTFMHVFVDYQMLVGENNWTLRDRANIGEVRDYVRGQNIFLAIMSRCSNDVEKDLVCWGEPTDKPGPPEHVAFRFTNDIRGRIALRSSDGQEQHTYFYLFHSWDSHGQSFPIVVVNDITNEFRDSWEN